MRLPEREQTRHLLHKRHCKYCEGALEILCSGHRLGAILITGEFVQPDLGDSNAKLRLNRPKRQAKGQNCHFSVRYAVPFDELNRQ